MTMTMMTKKKKWYTGEGRTDNRRGRGKYRSKCRKMRIGVVSASEKGNERSVKFRRGFAELVKKMKVYGGELVEDAGRWIRLKDSEFGVSRAANSVAMKARLKFDDIDRRFDLRRRSDQ